MAQADTNLGTLRYSVESTWGETPAGPVMTEVRLTSESLSHQKQTVVSQQVRSDRRRADVLEVGQSASGDVGFELSYGSFDDFFESALGSTIASAVVTNALVSITASTVTDPGGGFVSAGFKIGQHLRLTGGGLAAANSGAVIKVSTVAASTITFTGTTLTAEAVSAVINGRMFRDGVTEKSLLMEVNFTDLTAVKYFTGMEVGQMSLNVQSQQIVTGTFSFVGEGGVAASVTIASTVTTANSNVPMTAAANVGSLVEGGSALSTAIQSITLNVNGNLRSQPAVGQKPAIGVGQGGIDITGNLTAYFEDITLYNKMINHTSSSLSFRFTDSASNIIIVTIPKIYFTTGDPSISGLDADVFVAMDFVGTNDTTSDTMIQIDALPVTV